MNREKGKDAERRRETETERKKHRETRKKGQEDHDRVADRLGCDKDATFFQKFSLWIEETHFPIKDIISFSDSTFRQSFFQLL
jgi:hypothetical protein